MYFRLSFKLGKLTNKRQKFNANTYNHNKFYVEKTGLHVEHSQKKTTFSLRQEQWIVTNFD